MELTQLGELLLFTLLSAFAFAAYAARPYFLGIFRPNLGHASRDDLVESLNRNLLIFAVATVVACLMHVAGRPERALPALCVAAGPLAAYTVAMFRLR